MAEILDEIDLQILRTLQKNAKLTTKELAEAVHLTPTPGRPRTLILKVF